MLSLRGPGCPQEVLMSVRGAPPRHGQLPSSRRHRSWHFCSSGSLKGLSGNATDSDICVPSLQEKETNRMLAETLGKIASRFQRRHVLLTVLIFLSDLIGLFCLLELGEFRFQEGSSSLLLLPFPLPETPASLLSLSLFSYLLFS